LLPFVAIRNREIGDAQIRHVAPLGVRDDGSYLYAIDRNPKGRLLSSVLAPSGPLRHLEQGAGKHNCGAQPHACRRSEIT
jgi:hypothetical protein